MKRLLLIIPALCMFACSEDASVNLMVPMINEDYEVLNNHEIDAAKALEYANIYFNQTKTRFSAPLKMDYIVDKSLTRNGDITNDTVAYIINRGDNNGFVIVSSDDRVHPLLAYSNNGTFVNEKGSIVDVEFTSLIDDYIKENKDSYSKQFDEEYLSSCYYMNSVVDSLSQWHQREPFNYYVIEEHLSCPVGCVPLATGIIMLHCKSKFTYKGTVFNAKKIIRSIAKHHNPNYIDPSAGPFADTTVYPYDVAIDSVALLLYWIGKDLNTTYHHLGSKTPIDSAVTFLTNLGYSIKHSNLMIPYGRSIALSDMRSGYMLYMDGRNNGSITEGHTWVADGYDICVDSETGDTVRASIHCNWGWGGNCNGYYSSEIFEVSNYRFTKPRYNAIKLRQ